MKPTSDLLGVAAGLYVDIVSTVNKGLNLELNGSKLKMVPNDA